MSGKIIKPDFKKKIDYLRAYFLPSSSPLNSDDSYIFSLLSNFADAHLPSSNGDLLNSDFYSLANSDVLVANFSSNSSNQGFNQGFVLSHALSVLNIPVLALYDKSVSSVFLSDFDHPLLLKDFFNSQFSLSAIIENYFSSLTDSRNDFLFKNYFVFDAIDGAGKSAISKMLVSWASDNNVPYFNVIDYFSREKKIPSWDDVKGLNPDVSMLLVCEPTFADSGLLIRNEITNNSNGRHYSVLSASQMFAIDREILFKKLIAPALESGVIVASDRALVSSEHYQSLQADFFENYSKDYFLGVIRGLPGNKLASSYVPGLLMFLQVPAVVAAKRRKSRPENDNSIFERDDFQSLLAELYDSDFVINNYDRRGSRIIHFPVPDGESVDETIARAKSVWESYVSRELDD